MRYFYFFCLLFCQLLFASPPGPTSDLSNRKIIAAGYIANIPKQFLGIYVLTINPKNIGFYFDMKFDLKLKNSHSDYYENISINKAENIFHDQLLGHDRSYTTFDLGMTKRISKGFSLYSALGITAIYYYRQYHDIYEILGNHGNYWIDDSPKSATQINFMGGFAFLISPKVIFHSSINVQPFGLNVGLGICSDRPLGIHRFNY
jgi:hypothetical protein